MVDDGDGGDEDVDLAVGGLLVEGVLGQDRVGRVPIHLAEGHVEGAALAVVEREGLTERVGGVIPGASSGGARLPALRGLLLGGLLLGGLLLGGDLLGRLLLGGDLLRGLLLRGDLFGGGRGGLLAAASVAREQVDAAADDDQQQCEDRAARAHEDRDLLVVARGGWAPNCSVAGAP